MPWAGGGERKQEKFVEGSYPKPCFPYRLEGGVAKLNGKTLTLKVFVGGLGGMVPPATLIAVLGQENKMWKTQHLKHAIEWSDAEASTTSITTTIKMRFWKDSNPTSWVCSLTAGGAPRRCLRGGYCS